MRSEHVDEKRQLTMTTIFMGSGDTVSPEAGRRLGTASHPLSFETSRARSSKYAECAYESCLQTHKARILMPSEDEVNFLLDLQAITPDHHGYT